MPSISGNANQPTSWNGAMEKRDKAGKFIELANKRVNRAIKDLKLVANLASRRNYEYTEEQANKIVKALQKEIENVRVSFRESNGSSADSFEL